MSCTSVGWVQAFQEQIDDDDAMADEEDGSDDDKLEATSTREDASDEA